MDEPSRRTLLGALVVGSATPLAGSSLSTGTLDLSIRNCLPESWVVSVTATAESSGEVLNDARHAVTGETCTDAKEALVAVSGVVSPAVRYRVRGESPGLDPVGTVREFDEAVSRTTTTLSASPSTTDSR